MPSEARLLLVPGMGMDARMFGPQLAAIPGLEVVRWIEPRERESLASYASRLAAGLRDATAGDARPLVLGGVSLGAMLALEMARHLKPARLVIIAGASRPRDVSLFLRILERIGRVSPDWMVKAGRPIGAWVLSLGIDGREERRLLRQLVREAPIPFLRWASRAIMEWGGCDDPGVPVDSIHGTSDRVIPCRKVRAGETVAGGAHVLNLSHPAAVNAFLARARRVAAEDAGRMLRA